MQLLIFLTGTLVGAGVGVAFGVLWMRGRVVSQAAIADQVKALCADAVAQSGRQLLDFSDTRTETVLAPVKESLDHLDDRLREMERSRVALQSALKEQVESVRLSGEALRAETNALATALRKPQVRGRWGELHLARAAELAGLRDRCDVSYQYTAVDGSGDTDAIQRPDMVVHLAGGKHIVVDAKVPLGAFLDAAAVAASPEPTGEPTGEPHTAAQRDGQFGQPQAGQQRSGEADRRRDQLLTAHAKQVRAHVDALASKAYWRLLPATPEFVVLFMPGEAFLSHALEADASLLDYAAGRRVILATPSTLIALLRTVAYGWTEQALSANARQVFDLGRELYSRLGRLSRHLDRVGRSLNGAVGAYNEAIGSLETRVLVTARRLHDLDVTDEELSGPAPVDQAARPLAAPELVAEPDPMGDPEPDAEPARVPEPDAGPEPDPGRETGARREPTTKPASDGEPEPVGEPVTGPDIGPDIGPDTGPDTGPVAGPDPWLPFDRSQTSS